MIKRIEFQDCQKEVVIEKLLNFVNQDNIKILSIQEKKESVSVNVYKDIYEYYSIVVYYKD